MNSENPPPASAPAPTPEIFSRAAAQAALARLKAKAAAQQAAASVPLLPGPSEAVEITAEEIAANPEEARRRFDAIIADLRAAFAEWVAAKEEQFEQLLALGWSGQHEDTPAFLKHLEQETERLYNDAGQTHSDITSSAAAAESVEMDERLQEMKLLWDKLRAEGVPRDQWPLDAELPWGLQFQAQAEADPTGKKTPCWTRHEHGDH